MGGDSGTLRAEGRVGVDLWWTRLGEIGDASGVGAVTARVGAPSNDDVAWIEVKKGTVSILGVGEGVLVLDGWLRALAPPFRELDPGVGDSSTALSFPFRLEGRLIVVTGI